MSENISNESIKIFNYFENTFIKINYYNTYKEYQNIKLEISNLLKEDENKVILLKNIMNNYIKPIVLAIEKNELEVAYQIYLEYLSYLNKYIEQKDEKLNIKKERVK